jgi:hypothetical protein
MKRLDQGHLHPKPGEPGPPRWEASTLEKSHSNSLLIAIRSVLEPDPDILSYYFVTEAVIFSE